MNHPEKTVAGTTAQDVETPVGLLQVLILRVVWHKVFRVNKLDKPAFSGAGPSSARMPHLAFPGDSNTRVLGVTLWGSMPLGRGRTRALVWDYDEVFISTTPSLAKLISDSSLTCLLSLMDQRPLTPSISRQDAD